MNSIAYKILISVLIIVAFIGMSSYIPLNDPESNCIDTISHFNCDVEESPSMPLTSNGDILGFYTTLSMSSIPPQIDVVSFPAFSNGATTINGPWAFTTSLTQNNNMLPTNTSAYNPTLKELVCLVSGEQQLLKYEDVNMVTPTPIDVSPTYATAPVFFNNTYFALEIENNGYGDLPLFQADIVNFDFPTATFSSVLPMQFFAPPSSYFYHEIVSSATNITDEIYFLAGSNLIIVTDLGIWAPNYCWIDLAPNNSATNYFNFYGVEYKSPGVLMAIRETNTNVSTTAVDLVQINFNSLSCTVSSITVIYDMMNNFMPSPDGLVVNSEFYSTTYDACRKFYYVSTLFNQLSDSRLVEIDVQNGTHVEQILPEYLFGIEWKQKPCTCEPNFVIAEIDNCGNFLFTNTSTGSSPLTCSWDFGDPGSGVNNSSAQCQDMHQFSSCGSYNVCLTINANGCMKTKCQEVTVADNTPPVAMCKPDMIVSLNENCIANVSPTDIDAGSFDDCSLSLYDVTPNSFSQCGIFPVTLTVTDWCGNTGACNTTITVIDNMPPRITCPSDVYLSTSDPSCSMIVNGLQWLGLSDNCAVATLTYTVTGASNYSGVGDASGLLFDLGVSLVTYTATDICGNTSTCSFLVTIECLCHCTNNLVQNSGFNIGAVPGYMATTGQSTNWHRGFSPTNSSPYIDNFTYCCDPYSCGIYFYAPIQGSMDGTSIFQTGFAFSPAKHYKISFCALSGDGSQPKLGFTVTSTPIAGTFDPYNCTNCEVIGPSAPIPSSSWISRTLPIWTPIVSRDVLHIRGFINPGSQSNVVIDNICVEEVLYICCGAEQAFIENSDNAINSYVDFETREGVVEIGNFMECNSIDYIDWGDNTPILNGPIFGNTTLRHTYSEAGSYEVQYQVREFDPQDTSQVACFDHIFIDDIDILPDTCFCGDFSNMELRWGTNYSQQVTCGSDPVVLSCPAAGSGFDFTGSFYCKGTICPKESPLTWTLSGPGGNQSGTTIANPFFGISILPSYITQPGIYTLVLYGQCGNRVCDCVIQFVVDCPALCPCNPADILAFSNAVDIGYSYSSLANSCQVCFSPNALSNCEAVDWHLNSIIPTPLGTSNGNQPFCYTFPDPGSYTVIMVVNRNKPDGSDCETFTFSRQVTLQCQTLPTCNDPSIRNPNFTEGAIAGALGFGGMITGWKANAGAPIITQGLEGTQDEWSVLLRGNRNYADVLETEEAVCLDNGIGVISFRIGMGPQPTRPTRPCDILRVAFSADSNVKIIAEVPLTNLDSSEWWQVYIPYDVSAWIDLNDCNGNPGTISAHLQISVWNGLDDSQGGPLTFTEIFVDNVCLDNLVFVPNPVLSAPIIIHPNPNDGAFVLELPQPALKETTLQIITMTGKVIWEKLAVTGTSVQHMEASQLLPGIYFLKIVSHGHVMALEKFVKM